MKKISIFLCALLLAGMATSCQKPDSEKPWGSSVIYMPQANYFPYAVPNNGTILGGNRNYSIDKTSGKVHIFLGVYRAGLAEQLSYTVDVTAGGTSLAETTLLPSTAYTLPSSVTCPDGKRDVGFYLSVDIAYLKDNADKDFSLPVTVSNPTRYSLHETLVTTQVRINSSELIAKEWL
jgi:hypothetical protein